MRVDDAQYAEIEARAAAAGMSVPDYVRQVVADEANDLRHRFLSAAAYFGAEWGEHFAERFGHPANASSPAGRGRGHLVDEQGAAA